MTDVAPDRPYGYCQHCRRPMRGRRQPPRSDLALAHSRTICDACYKAQYLAHQIVPDPYPPRAVHIHTPPREVLDQAACVGTDPDAFFPEPGQDSSTAQRVCQSCPVIDACLDWAIANNEPHGIWGGHGRKSRDKIRKQRRLAA